MKNPLKMKSWPPYIVGAAIGILSWFTFLSAGNALGNRLGLDASGGRFCGRMDKLKALRRSPRRDSSTALGRPIWYFRDKAIIPLASVASILAWVGRRREKVLN